MCLGFQRNRQWSIAGDFHFLGVHSDIADDKCRTLVRRECELTVEVSCCAVLRVLDTDRCADDRLARVVNDGSGDLYITIRLLCPLNL